MSLRIGPIHNDDITSCTNNLSKNLTAHNFFLFMRLLKAGISGQFSYRRLGRSLLCLNFADVQNV